MTITDKTRKILWGRSGNRCAFCRHELVINSTTADDDSLVGDECHIVSGKGQGPRYDATFPLDHLDEPDNLILLCRVHHKMIDDQHQTYTVDLLRSLKANHEKWVSTSLTGQQSTQPVRVRRIKENIPTHLFRLTSGRAILAVVGGASAFTFDHEELKSQSEVDIISGFLQESQDYGDLAGDLEASDRVKADFEISARLKELEDAGFWVFGGLEIRRIEGDVGEPSPFPVAILRVVRANSPKIIKVDLKQAVEQALGQPPDSNRATKGKTDV